MDGPGERASEERADRGRVGRKVGTINSGVRISTACRGLDREGWEEGGDNK